MYVRKEPPSIIFHLSYLSYPSSSETRIKNVTILFKVYRNLAKLLI